MSLKPKVLVVDDEEAIRSSLRMIFEYEGYECLLAANGQAAIKMAEREAPDLVFLDIKMPQMDGMELLRRVREMRGEVGALPVIFLTSKDDEIDEALGLAMGADDYIAKPFSQRLLIARIRAILRRQDLAAGSAAAAESEPEIALLERGRLLMDPARHRISWNGEAVVLTVTEFMILEALAQRPGVVKTRNQLLDIAYQDDVYVDDRTIDSHIKRIRRKFRSVDLQFDAIETLYGVGYRFGEE
jgi:two-component system response regulator ChvI